MNLTLELSSQLEACLSCQHCDKPPHTLLHTMCLCSCQLLAYINDVHRMHKGNLHAPIDTTVSSPKLMTKARFCHKLKIQNCKIAYEHSLWLRSFVRDIIFKLLEDMLEGVAGDDDPSRYVNMFLQWLQPQPGVTSGNPDETYHIVEGLVTVRYSDDTTKSSSGVPVWQRPDADGVGSMKVIRVSDVRSGAHFVAMLETFLAATARPKSGPAWSGSASSQLSPTGRHPRWLLFAVIKDFSENEASKKLEQNVPRLVLTCSQGHFCLQLM